MERGMNELDAMQRSKMRHLELQKKAEIEHARAAAETEAHYDAELEEIINRHEKSSERMRKQMETERLHHKSLLQERIKRRNRQRREEHEKKQEIQAEVTAVDIETDLRFAQLELKAAEREADQQMQQFLASQQAFKEELERETALHHAHISERIKKRRQHRAALEQKKKEQAAKSGEKNDNVGSPASIVKEMQSIITGASHREMTEEGVNHLIEQLAALAGQKKSEAVRGAMNS